MIVVQKGIAGGGVGTPVSDIDALQKTLAVDEVFVFAATGEVGWGKAKYPNVTIPEKSNVIFDYDNGTLEITTISEGFSATKDTPAKVNVYDEGGEIKIQNKTAAPILLTYWPENK